MPNFVDARVQSGLINYCGRSSLQSLLRDIEASESTNLFRLRLMPRAVDTVDCISFVCLIFLPISWRKKKQHLDTWNHYNQSMSQFNRWKHRIQLTRLIEAAIGDPVRFSVFRLINFYLGTRESSYSRKKQQQQQQIPELFLMGIPSDVVNHVP